MKKLIFVLGFLLLTQGTGFSQTADVKHSDDYNKIQKSNNEFTRICYGVASNFRNDSRFSNLLRTGCTEFESERQRLLDIVYPLSLNDVPGYRENRNVYIANLTDKLNKSKLDSYKSVVTEYCKYNNQKVSKNRVSACLEVDKMFDYTMP